VDILARRRLGIFKQFISKPRWKMRTKQWWRTAILSGLVVLAFGAVVETSPSFQNCVLESSRGQSLEESIGKFPRIIRSQYRCGGEFFHKNAGALIALFTIVLAISTIGLWSSTRALWRAGERHIEVARQSAEAAQRAAEAAELNAKAAIGIELPVLRAEAPELLDVEAPVPDTGSLASGRVDVLPGRYSTVRRIAVRNHGRTPAFPSLLKVGWYVGRQLSLFPAYKHERAMRAQVTIEGEDETHIELPPHTIEMDQGTIDSLISKEAEFWYFVSISYRDFMDQPHEARFCWRWGCPDGAGVQYFASDGHPPAEYDRKS
jgi:hypothetical protein